MRFGVRFQSFGGAEGRADGRMPLNRNLAASPERQPGADVATAL